MNDITFFSLFVLGWLSFSVVTATVLSKIASKLRKEEEEI